MQERMQIKNTAIVLAAGHGSRMQSDVHKQFLSLKGKPVLFYSLQAFEQAPEITDVVLVTGEEEIDFCRTDIVDRFGFSKVKKIVAGGKERSDSVACGLRAIGQCDYVYIHDGARPFVTPEMITALQAAVEKCGACVAGMPTKDTVKLADASGKVTQTPPRSSVWIVHTPQVFSFALAREAYERYGAQADVQATDDAMVVERMTGHPVWLVPTGYQNIKLTTPEDMRIAEAFLA